MNNLYGKMASNKESSFKVAYLNEINGVSFMPVQAFDKKAGYIAVGSAITSYARNFTIRAAQENYYGARRRGFIYADTDSIHCNIPLKNVKGIRIHDTDFCAWKIENQWLYGWFTRQKTYIEYTHIKDGEKVDPEYIIKCAGLPTRCKNLLIHSFLMDKHKPEREYTQEERKFLKKKRTVKDFDVGLKVPGKLLPKRIQGGTVLIESFFEMRKN